MNECLIHFAIIFINNSNMKIVVATCYVAKYISIQYKIISKYIW